MVVSCIFSCLSSIIGLIISIKLQFLWSLVCVLTATYSLTQVSDQREVNRNVHHAGEQALQEPTPLACQSINLRDTPHIAVPSEGRRKPYPLVKVTVEKLSQGCMRLIKLTEDINSVFRGKLGAYAVVFKPNNWRRSVLYEAAHEKHMELCA